MVGSINPAPTPGTGVEPRAAREARAAESLKSAPEPIPKSDSEGPWRAARESLRQALADLDLTIAAARAAVQTIARLETVARAGDATGVLAHFAELRENVDRAIGAGAGALAGASVSVEIEREVPPFEILGLDLRLKDAACGEDALRLSRVSLSADAETIAREARDSVSRIQAGVERLENAARRLQAHDGFLAIAAGAAPSSVRSDLDADGARLLALQVRQGLSATNAAIANTRPDSILGLFRG